MHRPRPVVVTSVVPVLTCALLLAPSAAHARSATGATTTDPCTTATTPVGAVQGTGTTTPLDGTTVTVRGVVTLDLRGSATTVDDGYYLQDAGDGDDATSDAVFVAGGAERAVGEVVQVTGTAAERLGQTVVLATDEQACGTAAAAPAPVELSLPTSGSAELERREAMVVRYAQPLLVNDTRDLDDLGRLVLSDVVLRAPTDVAEPGAAAQSVAAANRLRSLVVDDGSLLADPRPVPYVPVGGTLRRGQSTTGLTGVLAADPFGFQLQPTAPVAFDAGSPRESGPTDVGGAVRVASYDVRGFFTTLGAQGAQSAADLQEQQDKLVAGFTATGADAVALQEVQNDPAALDALVAALDASGAGDWAGVPFPAELSTPDVTTTAIVYRADRLTRVGDPVAGVDPVNTHDPVAQLFEDAAGERFTVVSAHFTAKDGTGSGADLDTGDGQGPYNGARVQQAASLAAFVARLAEVDPDVVVLGDLNAYAREDPLDRLRAAGLVDVLAAHVDEADRYSFVSRGQQGLLDHAFVTTSLASRVTGADVWHANSDEPDLLSYDVANSAAYARPDAYRGSDHDPVLIGLGDAGLGTTGAP